MRRADFKSANVAELLSKFVKSRRQGLSARTIGFYEGYLTRASCVIGLEVTGESVKQFLNNLQCSNGGKHAYFRVLRAFYNWLYSPKSGMNMNPQQNPMLIIDAPKVEREILPSLTLEQVSYLIDKTDNLRDKTVISLLADSGMRLSEIASIKASYIDWENYTITIWGKGNKQRKAPFTERTAKLLRQWLTRDGHEDDNIWGLNARGIQSMLDELRRKTGLPCNAHTFRRTFACNLHRKGLSTLDIMHLGGWSDLSMVLRYTRSITFEDCLEHYKKVTL